MINLNVAMPSCCAECPCFHAWYPMYCHAVKAYRKKKIVSPYSKGRPAWCPIIDTSKNVVIDIRKTLRDDSGDEAIYEVDKFYRCPQCNRILSRTHKNNDIHYCCSCGQHVDWTLA